MKKKTVGHYNGVDVFRQVGKHCCLYGSYRTIRKVLLKELNRKINKREWNIYNKSEEKPVISSIYC